MANKKESQSEQVKKKIVEFLQEKGHSPKLIIKVSSEKIRTHFAALDPTSIFILDYVNKLPGIVESHSYSEWSSVEIDHFAVKSVCRFSGSNGQWKLETLESGKQFERFLRTNTELTVTTIKRSIWRKIPGYRSRKPFKMVLASFIYLMLLSWVANLFGGHSNPTSPPTAVAANKTSPTSSTPTNTTSNSTKKTTTSTAKTVNPVKKIVKKRPSNPPKSNTPDATNQLAFLSAFPSLNSSISVDPESTQFVGDHPQWFPANSGDTSYSQDVNHALTIPLLLKDPTPYYQQLYENTGTVVEIHQFSDPFNYAEIQVMIDSGSEAGSQAVIMYEGGTGSIVQNSTIQFIGLPICEWDFSNVSGGTTQSILFDGVSLKQLS